MFPVALNKKTAPQGAYDTLRPCRTLRCIVRYSPGRSAAFFMWDWADTCLDSG